LNSIDKDAVGTMAALYSIQPELSGSWSAPRLLQQQQTTVVISAVDDAIEENAQQSLNPDGSETQNSFNNSGRLRPSPTSVKPSNSPSVTPINPLTLSAVKRRKASRMREVEIADPQIVPPTDRDAFLKPDQNTVVSITEALTTPLEQPPPSTDSGHLTTKQRVEELRRVFGQENWLTSQAGNEVRLLLGWQETETKFKQQSTNNGTDVKSPLQEVKTAENSLGKDDAIVVLESESGLNVSAEDDSIIASQNDSNDEETDDLHIFVVQRRISSECPEERLMTISAAYLCEKDSLSGQTLSCWKRSSLQGMTVLQKSCTSRPIVRVQLTFYSAFRNSNEPIYDMEQDDFNVIFIISFEMFYLFNTFSFFVLGAGKDFRQLLRVICNSGQRGERGSFIER
jgi:hypothetical protein